MRGRVELSTRAIKDLRRLDRAMRDRMPRVLRDQLSLHPRPSNVDVVPLQGRAPWSRLLVAGPAARDRRVGGMIAS